MAGAFGQGGAAHTKGNRRLAATFGNVSAAVATASKRFAAVVGDNRLAQDGIDNG
jgi:hypothetical protein